MSMNHGSRKNKHLFFILDISGPLFLFVNLLLQQVVTLHRLDISPATIKGAWVANSYLVVP